MKSVKCLFVGAWIALMSAGWGNAVALAMPVDTTDKEAVRRVYVDQMLTLLRNPGPAKAWTGSVSGCQAGTYDPVAQANTFTMINAYRGLAGLYPVVEDKESSAKAQEAALMMLAQQNLSHSPGTGWACYSKVGAEAAGGSLLALGSRNGAHAITLYMDDSGPNNVGVGHREALLSLTRAALGSGSTSGSNAIYQPGIHDYSRAWHTISWPSKGYFPVELLPESKRWSTSGSDIAMAGGALRVEMTRNGAPLDVKVVYQKNNRLVWEIVGKQVSTGVFFDNGEFPVLEDDEVITFHVKIIGAGNAVIREYDVQVFGAARPPASKVRVEGRATVGSMLYVEIEGGWPDSQIQWFRDGVAIPGAVRLNYKLTKQDVGAKIIVRVRQADGQYGLWASQDVQFGSTIQAVRPVVRASRPTVLGQRRVGAVLRARIVRWQWTPGTTLRYQWLRNGRVIRGATGARYRSRRSDSGAYISVKVTGRKLGYIATSRTSLQVRIRRVQ